QSGGVAFGRDHFLWQADTAGSGENKVRAEENTAALSGREWSIQSNHDGGGAAVLEVRLAGRQKNPSIEGTGLRCPQGDAVVQVVLGCGLVGFLRRRGGGLAHAEIQRFQATRALRWWSFRRGARMSRRVSRTAAAGREQPGRQQQREEYAEEHAA